MHFVHGHLIADVLIFPPIIAWQGDINKIHFPRPVSLQKLEEPDLRHTYGTMPIIQHLKQSKEEIITALDYSVFCFHPRDVSLIHVHKMTSSGEDGFPPAGTLFGLNTI